MIALFLENIPLQKKRVRRCLGGLGVEADQDQGTVQDQVAVGLGVLAVAVLAAEALLEVGRVQ